MNQQGAADDALRGVIGGLFVLGFQVKHLATEVAKTQSPYFDAGQMMSTDKTYTYDDQILPLLARDGRLGGETCPITVILRDDSVVLRVGPRDWQWDRESGKFIGAGTEVASKVA